MTSTKNYLYKIKGHNQMIKPLYLYSARSHFSIGESMLSPKKIVQIAQRDGFNTVALVDTMTISGMTEFISECKKASIKPIIGCRLRIVKDLDYRKPARTSNELPKRIPEWYPKVYVKNEQGMVELMKLLSLASSPERFYYEARLSFEDLLVILKNDNLIISTGDQQNIFALHDDDYNYELLIDRLLSETKRQNCFVELFNNNSIFSTTLNKKVSEIAESSMAFTLLTNTLLYDVESDADTLDVLTVIISNNRIRDSWRPKQHDKSFYAKSPEQLTQEMQEFEVEYNGIDELINGCQYEWKPMSVSLPKMAEDEQSEIVRQVTLGWKERIKKPIMGYMPPDELIPLYKERLAYELSVLRKMRFERYFLVVQDVVKWSKQKTIMVGPGRGSAAGSLVSFLMGITDVDPIRFNLLFERFINPDRLDLPDVDLDFMSTRRGEIIDYLVEKYGADRVAGISNYGTLASASALRDCGRVYGLSNEDLSATRYVPKENGASFTLTEAAIAVPAIESFKVNYPDIWHHATRLEGVMRSLGKHAAGIVVADEPISNRAVVETRSGTALVNWDRNSVESWGLVKMDILGLSTLDTLRIALDYIKENHSIDLDLLSLPIDDYETMKGFSLGKTIGIFQFNSGGMRHLLKELAKGGMLNFEDICATTALYRPGPMESGMMDTYIKVKQGIEDPEYDHPKMKHALQATGGVFIYQESVMQIARDLAGYTMADADKLRKIMGKKQRDEMEKQRDKFVSGCVKYSDMNEAKAGELFDKIDKFAGYGFNRSHSVVYSVISYWSMYLKTHYSAEYFAAMLTTVDKEDQLQAALFDAQKYNVYVVPPDINISTNRFEFRHEPDEIHLVAPFNKLKGLSEKTALAILEARATVGGKFKSRANLLANVRRRNCTSKHMNILDLVGSFANIEAGTLPVRHPDRLKDQIELLPGLVCEYVKADRYTKLSDIAPQASALIRGIRACEACLMKDEKHCLPIAGNKVKFMVITDSPNSTEALEGKSLKGEGCRYMLGAMKEANIKKTNGYFTTLVKVQKPKEIKTFPNEVLLSCTKFIDEEIKLVNPAVIVAMGGATIRHFYPDVKGSWSELCGRVIYNKELDANIVFGINPQMCFFREEAQAMMDDVFRKVYEMVE
jgi:DNA polymerase-3 subunit alpha